MTEETIFPAYPTARWMVNGDSITFPVQRLQESGGNRLAKHLRIYRDGARIDDTGSDPKTWIFTCTFFNSEDPQEDNVDLAQYPDNVNKLIESFDQHECGDLTVPTRGPVRARAEKYDRIESAELRDACVCTFTFVEDNEDDDRQAAYTAPSAASSLGTSIGDAVDACEALGAIGDSLSSLQEFGASLEGLATAPGEYLADMEAQAAAVEATVASIEETFASSASSAVSEVRTLLTDPAASLAGKRLRKAADLAAQMTLEKVGVSWKRIVSRTWPQVMSIFEVSIDVGQGVEGLMALNASLPDMLAIAAGTAVRVYASS